MNKELEALKKHYIQLANNSSFKYTDFEENRFKFLEQKLERLEKLEKVWDIVDKKQVAWGLIVRCQSVEEYNKCTVEFLLTETEFNLLKEMLRK